MALGKWHFQPTWLMDPVDGSPGRLTPGPNASIPGKYRSVGEADPER
jgi:hypothetical protein